MTRKLMVLGLAAALVIAFAVPAFGETTTVTPNVTQELSVRALAKARLALLTARSAKSQSRVAVRTAEAAMNAASKATGPAGPTGPPGPAGTSPPPVQSDFVAAGVSTESVSYVQLAGGPSISVNVPASGLIEVWAQATMSDPALVSLYEDGHQMPGQSEDCGPEENTGVLFAGFVGPFGSSITAGTPAPAEICGTEGAPGSVLFQTTPGKHTYELRYEIAGCGCAPEVTFSNRLLRIAPRL